MDQFNLSNEGNFYLVNLNNGKHFKYLYSIKIIESNLRINTFVFFLKKIIAKNNFFSKSFCLD